MIKKIFSFEQVTVFFKHTDNHGFAHPYNYLEWMSYAREAFFQQLVPNFEKVYGQNIKIVTYRVEMNFLADVVFGNKVTILIYSRNIKRLSFDVVFDFFDQNQKKIGNGTQTLTFLDGINSRAITIPEQLKQVVLEFEKN